MWTTFVSLRRTPPSVQDVEARPVYLDTDPYQVLDEILHQYPVIGRVNYQPEGAATWGEVHRIDFPWPLHACCPLPYDLRHTR